MNVKLRRATRTRAAFVFDNLRWEDQQEVDTAGGFSDSERRNEVLLAGWKASKVSYAIEVDGRTVAVLGLVPTPVANVVWMLCTDEVGTAKKAVLRRCTDVAAKWYRRYGTLLCIADNRNTLHHRWIKRIGFERHGEADQNGFPFTQYLYRGR
jgi:hypothetical protein